MNKTRRSALRGIPRGFCAAGLAVFLLWGCYLFPKEEKILAPPLMETPEITYDVIEVEKATIEKRISGSGTFIPVAQSDHFFRYGGGRLRRIAVNVGDPVEKGDLLVELDTEDLEREIRQQRLMLRKAELAYESLEAQQQDRSAVELAQLELELAELQLEDAQEELREAEDLLAVDRGLAVQRQVQDLKSAVRRQAVAVKKAEIQLERLRQIAEDNTAATLAAIDVDLAKLKLDGLVSALEQSWLYSAMSGRVTYVNTQLREGDFVEAYRTIVTVSDPTVLQLQHSGTDIGDYSLGRKVEVKIRDAVFEGTVVMTPLSLPYDAEDYLKDKIRIHVPDLPEDVTIGSPGYISLVLDRKEDVIVLPRSVVMRYGTRRYVRVLESGLKEERDVQVGIETPTEVEIVKGLQEGDKVIVR